MAKMKKMKGYLKYVDVVMALLAVASFVMLFVTAFTRTVGDTVENYSGMNIVFGHTVTQDLGGLGVLVGGDLTREMFKFSFMNMLTYILVLAVVVFAVVGFIKQNKRALVVAILFALIAGVFFLLTKSFTVPGNYLTKLYEVQEITFTADKSISLGAGPVVGAVCTFVSAALGIGKILLDK